MMLRVIEVGGGFLAEVVQGLHVGEGMGGW